MTSKSAYSIDQAAESLSISRSMMKELIYTGKVKVIKVGRRVLVPKWCLDEFLSSAESMAPGPEVEWDKMMRGG